MTPTIRYARIEDIPAIMTLLQLHAKAAFDGAPGAFQARAESLRQAWFSASPKAFVLVTELEGQLVGLATYYLTFSTFLGRSGFWLADLFVLEGHRSRGIGKKLLIQLARIAKDSDCARMEWTVAHNNERGAEFYRRHGASMSPNTRHVRLTRDGIESSADAPYP